MVSKDSTFYPLIVLFFLLGLVLGYVIHVPETVIKPEYINRTVEVPVGTEVSATPTPIIIPTAPTAAPEEADFSVRNYNPFKDKPSETMEILNWRVVPDALRAKTQETVLIKISDSKLQSPMRLILNSTYERNLGTSGAAIIIFNKKGTYRIETIIPNPDPSILPTKYAEGKIIIS